MPKPVTTAAMTLVTNRDGTVVVQLNAKGGAGARITEWSMDWGDGEEETSTAELPSTASHAYVAPGGPLLIFSVKDSKNKIASTGMSLVVTPIAPPIPPEPGDATEANPVSNSG